MVRDEKVVEVLNKNVSSQAEVRDFKHSRGPPVRHVVSQFKGTDDDDYDDDIVMIMMLVMMTMMMVILCFTWYPNPKVSCQQTNHGALSECIWI